MVYCSKCGTQVPDDASFCPKCGAPVGGAQPEGPEMFFDRHVRRQMRRQMRWGLFSSPEYRLIEALSAGLIIILLGVLLFMAAAGVTTLVTWSNFWAYFLIGIGAFLLLRSILGMIFLPSYAFHRFGGIIVGIIFIVIGAAGLSISLFGWDKPFWPLIIVAGGVLVIAVGIANFLTVKREG